MTAFPNPRRVAEPAFKMADATPHSEPPLAGRRGWIITDEKIGMQVQVRGVAGALGLAIEHKRVAPAGLYRILSPWGPVARRDLLDTHDGILTPPWPDIAIATGRLSIPYLRTLRRLAGPATFTVVLQDPKTGPGTADLIWVPEHDRLRGANVITTPTAPHGFTAVRLALLRRDMPPAITALPAPRVSVVLGGPSGTHSYTDADAQRLATALASIARLGASFLITPSRRTPQSLLAAVDAATARSPRILWRGTDGAANPYPDFLAHADWLVVTADSVNMTGEAASTGKPVYVFEPSGGSAKFARFHDGLRRYGATRPLPDRLTHLEAWRYQPLDSASIIAAEIERRWLAR